MCRSSLTFSGHHFFTPIWLAPIPVSFLHSKRSSAFVIIENFFSAQPSVFHPDHELHLSTFLLTLFHILYSLTSLKHPGIYPCYVTARYLFPSLSILSSLQLGPHDPHLNPALVPFGYQARSSDRIPTFSLFTFITSTHKTVLALLPKHKTSFFRKITTKLCSLVLIDSHAVMISGLHWVFHTTCPEPVSLSFTPHPLPAFILLYKVLP